VEQSGQGGVAFAPERPDHVSDKDAAGVEPHVAVILPGLGDELAGDAVGVGGVGNLGEGRPVGAPGIERVQDHVAALGLVVMRDELAAGVIDQGGFAPRFDPVEHLAQGGGLAAAGRADHRHVPGFEPAGNGNGANAQGIRLRLGAGQRRQSCLARHQRSGDNSVTQRAFAPPGDGSAQQDQAHQPSAKAQRASPNPVCKDIVRRIAVIGMRDDRAGRNGIGLAVLADRYGRIDHRALGEPQFCLGDGVCARCLHRLLVQRYIRCCDCAHSDGCQHDTCLPPEARGLIVAVVAAQGVGMGAPVVRLVHSRPSCARRRWRS
jgi:hypothetical protein